MAPGGRGAGVAARRGRHWFGSGGRGGEGSSETWLKRVGAMSGRPRAAYRGRTASTSRRNPKSKAGVNDAGAPVPVGMRRRWTVLMAMSCLLAGASVASARDGGDCLYHTGTDGFAREDENLDGVVTLAEAYDTAAQLFEYFDRNRDGQVTVEESDERALGWRQRRFEERFTGLDRDANGALSPSEAGFTPQRFARADRDRDGRLSRAELSPQTQTGSRGKGDTAALRATFWRRDLDRDHRVTRAEALSFAERRFLRRDRDGNRVLTRDEHRASGSAR
jgi:EF hand domain-containing protein